MRLAVVLTLCLAVLVLAQDLQQDEAPMPVETEDTRGSNEEDREVRRITPTSDEEALMLYAETLVRAGRMPERVISDPGTGADDGPSTAAVIELADPLAIAKQRVAAGLTEFSSMNEFDKSSPVPRDLPASGGDTGGTATGSRATGPTRKLDTDDFPWSGNVKIYTDGGAFSCSNSIGCGCSGSMVGPRTLITAAHCVYDPPSDTYASTLLAVPGHSDWRWPTSGLKRFEDFPKGYAWGTHVQTYSKYTNDDKWEYDFAIVTLDRRIGDVAGHFGIANYWKNGETAWLSAYPGATLEGYFQYYKSGDITAKHTRWLTSDLPAESGDSGGNIYWIYSGRYVNAVHVGRINQPYSELATRVSTSRYNDIVAAKDSPPSSAIDKSNIVEWVGDNASKHVSPGSRPEGHVTQVKFQLYNCGQVDSNTISYTIYASLNDLITDLDIPLASGTTSSLCKNCYRTIYRNVVLPYVSSDTNYYIGVKWSLSGDHDNFRSVMTVATVTVTNSPGWIGTIAAGAGVLLVAGAAQRIAVRRRDQPADGDDAGDVDDNAQDV